MKGTTARFMKVGPGALDRIIVLSSRLLLALCIVSVMPWWGTPTMYLELVICKYMCRVDCVSNVRLLRGTQK